MSPSERPERLGGRHPGRAQRGRHPGGGADDHRRAQPTGPGHRRDDGGPALAVGVDGGGGGPGEYPGQPAGQREQDRFGQELGADVVLGGPEGATRFVK